MDLEATLRSSLGDRYEIEGEVARGGMSHVFRARDLKHNRTVAIKALRPEMTGDVAGERFLREVEISASITHPHILPIFDSGKAGEVLFYVMPYVRDESLRTRLERRGQLPVDEALEIACGVAAALECAHSRGVIHRDIKPANILLESGEAVVADFGIARAISPSGQVRITETGVTLGTPAYMSPEQAAGDKVVDERSDLYSLGCVLYEMLAGVAPFTGPSAQAVMAMHLHGEPPALNVLRPGIPAGVEGIVARAMRKSAADRFQTSSEMLAALRDPTQLAKAQTRHGRLRRVAIGAAVVVLAAAGAAIAFMSRAGAATTDPNTVMVFPLSERGGVPAGVGYDAAIWIENALNHTEPLRFEDGWTWLDPARRSDPSLVSVHEARELSRNRAARHYVTGSVLGTGSSSTITLQLHDAETDRIVARETALGGVDHGSILGAALEAIAELIPSIVEPGRTLDRESMDAIRRTHPAAVAQWIQGEREYRASHFDNALAHYQAAIESDSTWAFAAFKGAQAASWSNRVEPAIALVDLALANEAVLPAKYRSFAYGLRHYLLGEPLAAVSRFQEALALDPEWAEGWMGLGEVYYHLQPGWTNLKSQARHAFHRAIDADSSFVLPLYHLSEIALERGHLEQADRMIRIFTAAGPALNMRMQLALMQGCIREGPGAIDWANWARESVEGVVRAGLGFGVNGHQLDCAEAALNAVLKAEAPQEDWVWGAQFALNNIAVIRGRAEEARKIIEQAIAAGRGGAVALHLVNAFAGAGEFDESAAELVPRLLGDLDTMDSGRLWYLGSWYDHTKTVDGLRAVVNALERRSAETDSVEYRMLAGGMGARLAATEGDTTLALDLLEEIHPYGRLIDLEWDFEKAMAQERLLLGELLLARGEYERAIAVAEGFELEPKVYMLYMPRSLAIRVEAARALGDDALVTELTRRLGATSTTDPGAGL